MPLLPNLASGHLGQALLAKSSVALGKASDTAATLFYPVQKSDHNQHLDYSQEQLARRKVSRLPNLLDSRHEPLDILGKRQHWRAFSNFLGAVGANAESDLCLTTPRDDHVNFLFGADDALAHRPAGSQLLINGRFGKAFRPHTAMMAMSFDDLGGVWRTGQKEADEQPTGWVLQIPRGLRTFLTVDTISAIVLGTSMLTYCDVPLKAWLFGGIMLGFPMSEFVRRVARNAPIFQDYRLCVTKLRGGGEVEGMNLGRVVLYDRFSLSMDEVEEGKGSKEDMWKIHLFQPELVTAYQILTSEGGDSGKDPIEWRLEGSADGKTWTVLHTVDGANRITVPSGRGALSEVIDELDHLEDATSAFRGGFLLEVAASALSFAWLVAGTTWVSAGSETCVDSAPSLWLYCYLLVVSVWSMLGTVTIGLIVSAVAMVVFGVKSPSRN